MLVDTREGCVSRSVMDDIVWLMFEEVPPYFPR